MKMTATEIRALPAMTELKVDISGRRPRVVVEDDYYVFEFAKGARVHGYRYSIDRLVTSASTIELKYPPEKVEADWHKRIHRALKCMESSGLWPEYIERYKLLDTMTYADKKAIYALYWSKPQFPYKSSYTEEEIKERNDAFLSHYGEYVRKYPFVFSKKEPYGLFEVDTFYIWELSECKLKSMYFGKYDNPRCKETICKNLKEKISCMVRGESSYDVTFEYDADTKKAWYSEEYKGCANGHYYFSLDQNTALFAEND